MLVRATPDQHERIREFLNYIDVSPGSPKSLLAYELKNIKADAAKKILEELDRTDNTSEIHTTPAEPNEPLARESNTVSSERSNGSSRSKPHIVINESTNALLINATKEQHNRIANIINYIDKKASLEEMSYQFYPLENSSPEHICDVLNQLIAETAKNKDDKIIREPKTQEQITIVPDSNTFSLVVYASNRNQKWIKELTNMLDRRRPQVLIDVTLVEITRTESFETDLDIIANARDSAVNNIIIDPIQNITSGSIVEGGYNQRDNDGNPTGKTRVFYSDEKVQALLTAIQQKNYGRVLAKPKILVDDGQEGQITTSDVTSYVKETIQIPQTGSPITTRDFLPVEASIDLLITPHISEGDLLRLAVKLSRDDFGSRPLSGGPPDITKSKVNTTVFVPDQSTVILGGLVKLNQSKGHSKVPILGNLPLIGFLFRSIGNSDVEKKLYVFLKANIIRPYEQTRLKDLQEISDKYRESFEKSESQFQNLQDIPGIKSPPMQPEKVLRGYE